MAMRCFLLLLPALAVARISIDISGTVDQDRNNLVVKFSGSDVNLISDVERDSFQLSENTIKNAVEAYFGARPDNAFLRSPTPWGDLYKSYGWAETRRTLRPISAKLLKIASQPTIVSEQIFENNSTEPETFNVGISQPLTSTVASKWIATEDLTAGQISYELDLASSKSSGSTSFSYSNSWGQDAEKFESVTVGSGSDMEVLLQPQQSVLAELHAMKASVRVEVVYEASLAGRIAVNYDELFKGHHFWNIDLAGLMQGLKMKNSLISKEVIDVEFYSNARVMVHDRQMGYKMLDIGF